MRVRIKEDPRWMSQRYVVEQRRWWWPVWSRVEGFSTISEAEVFARKWLNPLIVEVVR